MRVSEAKIAEISAAADIVQVISGYVNLKKAGKDYRGLCPFHGDKDPSFYVSPQKGIFHCFGCATGGSVFNFIMKIENVSFVEAVELLAKRYGISLQLEKKFPAPHRNRDRLLKTIEAALVYFQENLRQDRSAQEYLENRGVSRDWMERLRLGYATDSWDGLLASLRGNNISVNDIAAAGLIRPRGNNNGYYDYFRSRIMIPISDLNGNIVAFGGRIYGQGEPKYLNSPESTVFRKRNILYGLSEARDAIRKQGCAVLVEGYFDQISLRTRGIENTVAPLGTAIGLEQIKILRRFTDEVVIVFDGDEAGLRALKRAIPLFLSEAIEPRCLILQQDKDPDEAIRRLGAEAFQKMLDRAGSAIDFLLDNLEKKYDLNTLSGRNLALEECIPIVREVADSKEGDYLIERFSSRLRIKEDRFRRIVRSAKSSRKQSTNATQRNSLYYFPAAERNVVRGMLLKPGFMDRVLESGIIKDLDDQLLKTLAELMIKFRQERGHFDVQAFSLSLEDEKLASIVAGWLQPRPEEDDLRPEVDGDAAIEHSLDSIRLRKLEKRKAEIKERMKKCNPGDEEYNLLAKELWAIGRRLHK